MLPLFYPAIIAASTAANMIVRYAPKIKDKIEDYLDARQDRQQEKLEMLAEQMRREAEEDYTCDAPAFDAYISPPPGTWHGPGSAPCVVGWPLSPGMVYVGTQMNVRSTSDTDACLINPELPVDDSAMIVPIPDKNNISYETFTPEQRGIYLRWLSNGRSDPTIDPSFVKLYLSGLERRLLIDGPRDNYPASERLALLQEIVRLMQVFEKSPEIMGYSEKILAMAWCMVHDPRCVMKLPNFMNFFSSNLADIFPWNLARVTSQNKCIDPETLLQWYCSTPSLAHHDIVSKYPTVILNSISPDILRLFGYSIFVPPARRTLVLHYHAVSPSLGTIEFPFPNIKDVSKDIAILQRITPFISKYAADLTKFNAWCDEHGGDVRSLAALNHYPDSLFPSASEVKAVLKHIHETSENGLIMMTPAQLFGIMGLDVPEVLSEETAIEMSKLLARLDLMCAPDIRIHRVLPRISDPLVIAKGAGEITLSPIFRNIVNLLRLCAVMAQCDGNVSGEETHCLQQFILSRTEFREIEKKSLLIWLHWCLNTPQPVSSIGSLAEGLPRMQYASLFRVLIAVARADGEISENELQALCIIFGKAGILTNHCTTIEDYEEVLRHLSESNATPKPPKQSSIVHHINYDRNPENLRQVSSRGIDISLNLQDALASICDEDDMHLSKVFEPLSSFPKYSCGQKMRDCLSIFATQNQWPRETFFAIASQNKLMGDWLMDEINQWANLHGMHDIFTDGQLVMTDTETLKGILS